MPLPDFPLNPFSDYGLKRITGFKTLVHPLGDGYEQRIGKQPSGALHRFALVLKNRLTSDMATNLYAFFKARKGRLEAFNVTDVTQQGTPVTRKVRFEEDELEEEFFYTLLENAQLTIQEIR